MVYEDNYWQVSAFSRVHGLYSLSLAPPLIVSPSFLYTPFLFLLSFLLLIHSFVFFILVDFYRNNVCWRLTEAAAIMWYFMLEFLAIQLLVQLPRLHWSCIGIADCTVILTVHILVVVCTLYWYYWLYSLLYSRDFNLWTGVALHLVNTYSHCIPACLLHLTYLLSNTSF